MKLKTKKQKPVTEELFEEVDESPVVVEAICAECNLPASGCECDYVPPPETKTGVKAVDESNAKRVVITLADIDDKKAYAIYGYKLREFGCEYRPALGEEIRYHRERSKDFGVVQYYAPNTKGITATGTFHHAPKGDMMLRLADDLYIAIHEHTGEYEPAYAQRRFFTFGPLSQKEQRVLTMQTKKKRQASLKALRQNRPKLRFNKT